MCVFVFVFRDILSVSCIGFVGFLCVFVMNFLCIFVCSCAFVVV